MIHHAGRSASRNVPQWQALRRQHPEWFEGDSGIEVFAQPSAVVDSIIQGWQIESLGRRYPLTICQKDMLGSYRSASSQEMMQVVHMLDAPILGKMTPVLQVTDTDVARLLKVIADSEKWS